jgi:hypothetical protein
MTMDAKPFSRRTLIIAAAVLFACAPLDTIRDILESGGSPSVDTGGLDPLPPPSGTLVSSGPTLYVSTAGNDANDCLTAAAACRTIPEAVGKAEWRSEIRIAPGSYDGALRITKDVLLIGEPSSPARILHPATVSAGVPNVSIRGNARVEMSNLSIEGDPVHTESSTAHGLLIEAGSTAALTSVSIRNNRGQAVYNIGSLYYNGGSVTGNDAGIGSAGTAELRGVDILANGGSNFGSYGFNNRGEAVLEDVNVRDNDAVGILHGAGSITLTGGEITGNRGDGFRSEGGVADVAGTLFDGNSGSGVTVHGGTVRLNGVRIEHSLTGLFVDGGAAEAEDTSIRNNGSAGIKAYGGRLSLSNVETSGNVDGVDIRGDTQVTADGSVFEDNTGFGVILAQGRLTLRNGRVAHNGFGLRIAGGTASIETAAVSGNGSWGVHIQQGALTLRDVRIADNGGIGLWQYGDPSDSALPETVIERAAIVRNGGDGINLQAGSLDATNLTVSGNAANGIAVSSTTVSLSFSTVVFNEGQAGIYVGGDARMTSANNIVVSNASVIGDCYTYPGSMFSHLGLDLACRADLNAFSLRLGPLTETGGTLVHPLTAESPAVDSAIGPCPAVDQRGVARPAGGGCDVGAFEYNPLASAVPASGSVTGILIVTANCRIGPGTAYSVLAVLPEGLAVAIDGRNDLLPRWWRVLPPAGPAHCWVSDDVLTVEGPAADLPPVEAPPLPAPEPVQPNACYVFNGQNQLVCTAPCPPNAQPGGACQP